MFECNYSDSIKPPCRGSAVESDGIRAAEELAHRGCFLTNLASMRKSLNRPRAPYHRRKFDWHQEPREKVSLGAKGFFNGRMEENASSLPKEGPINDGLTIGEEEIAIF